MKYFAYALLATACLLTSACLDDDDQGPITSIGRADGWFIESVTTDFQERFEDALAAVDDGTLAAADTTREAISDAYARDIAEVDVDDCDRDDALFFLGDGQFTIIFGPNDCPDNLNTLSFFVGQRYATDLAGTSLRLRNTDGMLLATYDIETINGDEFIFSRTVTVIDTLLGDFNYEVEYELTAR